MLIPFNELPGNARVWVYQADRELNTAELETLDQYAASFTEKWAAHGISLKAGYQILHSRFLILAVDEQYHQASGCSIDSSVHMIQQLEQAINVNWFDRTKVAFILNNEVFVESLNNLKGKVNDGIINKDTLMFNNNVANKEDLEHNWLVPAGTTWMSRYFK